MNAGDKVVVYNDPYWQIPDGTKGVLTTGRAMDQLLVDFQVNRIGSISFHDGRPGHPGTMWYVRKEGLRLDEAYRVKLIMDNYES